MKASELMIGSWVVAQPDEDIWGEGAGTVLGKVDEIFDYDGVLSVSLEGFDCPVAVGLLDSVSITPEILEKNGWKCYNTYHRYTCSNVPFDLQQQEECFSIMVAGNEYGYGIFTFIKYVHQLQHALRLCGITREIIL